MEKNKSTSSLRRRSLGVIIFGVIAIIIGLFFLYSFASCLQFRPREMQLFHSAGDPYLLFLLILSFGFVISGIFLLKLKNWARILFMVLMGMNILVGLLGARALNIANSIAINKNSPFTINIGFLLFFVFPFIISIYYFTRFKVKEQFK